MSALNADAGAPSAYLRSKGEAEAIVRSSGLDVTILRARDAFRMATEFGARVLGVDRLGRLEPGWVADVAAFRIAPGMVPVYDPIESLVYSGSGRDACLTVVDGEVLYRDGTFTRLDIADAVARLAKTAEAIRQHVPQAFG